MIITILLTKAVRLIQNGDMVNKRNMNEDSKILGT